MPQRAKNLPFKLTKTKTKKTVAPRFGLMPNNTKNFQNYLSCPLNTNVRQKYISRNLMNGFSILS